jgi:hypothetical protein
MKKGFLLIIVFLIPILTNARFEQKAGINMSSGVFKTFGKKIVVDGPLQMSNDNPVFISHPVIK